MGYYSDVALCFDKKTHDYFLKRVEDVDNPDIKDNISSLLNCATFYVANKDSDDEAVLYQWSDTKWYEYMSKLNVTGFEDVEFIMAVLEDLDNYRLEWLSDSDKDIPEYRYRFMRVGEEWDDSVSRGEFDDDPFELGLIREIYVRIPLDPDKVQIETF